MIQDQLGRKLNIETAPQRVVSLVPSLTELICDLGLQPALVGVTKFCVHPSDVKESAQIIGGTKNPNIEKILALKPDLIIANKEENRPEDIAVLEKYCAVYVSDIQSISDSLEMVTAMGEVFERVEEAKQVRFNLERVISQIGNHTMAKTPITALYLIWQKPYMAAGTDTYISKILELFGIENAANRLGEKSTRYPEMSPSEIVDINPDMILLSSEPYPFKSEHCASIAKIFNKKTILVDGELFSWYGTRLIKCFPSVTDIDTDIRAIFR